MSMEMHNIIQFFELFIGYLAFFVAFPGIVFHKKTKHFSASKRFLIHFLIGNLYALILVYLLEFFHIASAWTLWLLTIGSGFWLWKSFHREEFSNWKEVFLYETAQLWKGQLGIRTYVGRRSKKFRSKMKKRIKALLGFFKEANVELFFFALILWFLWQICGNGILENCGYASREIFEHNRILNRFMENDIASMQPWKLYMDAILYYLIGMLNFSAFTVCRLFWLVQYSMLIFLLLAFLKCFCKSKYLPYFGIFLYLVTKVFYEDTYRRFALLLPEQFRFLFVLPMLSCLAFLLEESKNKKDARYLGKIEEKQKDIFFLQMVFRVCIALILIFALVSLSRHYLELLEVWGKYVVDTRYAVWTFPFIFIGIFLGAFLFFMGYERKYGLVLLGFSCLFLVLCFQLNFSRIGTVTFLNTKEVAAYLAYFTPALLVFSLDAMVYLVSRKKMKEIGNFMSLLMLIACLFLWMQFPLYKQAFGGGSLQKKETVLCMENILRQNKGKNFTWSLVSTSDEAPIIEEYGKHIESMDFLGKVQDWNKSKEFKISSRKTYFFIEKKPILTKKTGLKSEISPSMAALRLPLRLGQKRYENKNRLIVMSNLFYWAKSFQQLHPKQFKVYYETSNFVCYYIEQDEKQRYNFAIDYGFNK